MFKTFLDEQNAEKEADKGSESASGSGEDSEEKLLTKFTSYLLQHVENKTIEDLRRQSSESGVKVEGDMEATQAHEDQEDEDEEKQAA